MRIEHVQDVMKMSKVDELEERIEKLEEVSAYLEQLITELEDKIIGEYRDSYYR